MSDISSDLLKFKSMPKFDVVMKIKSPTLIGKYLLNNSFNYR